MSSLLDLLAAAKAREALLKKEKARKYVREHKEIIQEQKRQSSRRRKTSQ
jgi:hypothetical protein